LLLLIRKNAKISAPTEEKKITQKYLSKKGSICFNLVRGLLINLFGLEVEEVVIRRNLDKSIVASIVSLLFIFF